MASTSAPNPDPIIPFLDLDSGAGGCGDRNTLPSESMDELLKNMYADGAVGPAFPISPGGGGGSTGMAMSRQPSLNVWNDMPTAQQQQQQQQEEEEDEMTLEAFLTKAGAVTEEDVGILGVMPTPGLTFNADPAASSVQFHVPELFQSTQTGAAGGFGVDPVGFADGIDTRILPLSSFASGSGGLVRRRVKRTAVDVSSMDKASQQRHKRMIKNRESAARSRERKQAYTNELEGMVAQLQQEKAMLLREQVERTKARYKQLMESLIPVTEKGKPRRPLRRVLRRTNSM